MIINIFSYPEYSKRREITIKYIKELIRVLKSKYGIHLCAEVVDGHRKYHSFSQFLIEFFESCKHHGKQIDIYWLGYLIWIIQKPSEDLLSYIKSSINSQDGFIKSLLVRTLKNSSKWNSVLGSQFIVLEDLKLRENQGAWGANIGEYPLGISIEITGYKESIFHEFLHLLGVKDGYNKITKSTNKDCENCWMQYDATKGKGLCEKHQEELKKFLEDKNVEYV